MDLTFRHLTWDRAMSTDPHLRGTLPLVQGNISSRLAISFNASPSDMSIITPGTAAGVGHAARVLQHVQINGASSTPSGRPHVHFLWQRNGKRFSAIGWAKAQWSGVQSPITHHTTTMPQKQGRKKSSQDESVSDMQNSVHLELQSQTHRARQCQDEKLDPDTFLHEGVLALITWCSTINDPRQSSSHRKSP